MKEKMTKQDYFMVVFLSLVAATPPIATDVYLPAIPTIARQYGDSESLVSLSLILWFAAFSISLLLSGPLSDKFGRKPVLLSGLLMFIGGSLICGFAESTYQLIGFRVIQGIGAGAPSSVAMAVTRDKYSGKTRQMILAYIGSILAIAPMLAPSIGSLILQFSQWPMIFLFQAIMGMISFIAALFFRETNLNKTATSILRIFFRYIPVMKNRGFMKMNTAMGLIITPFYAFIAFSPLVYLGYYHVSSTVYGLLFGFNASMSMAGALIFSILIKRIEDHRILNLCIAGCIVGGIGILLLGNINVILMAVFMAVFSLFSGMSRPVSNSLILDQVDSDIGTASSFIMFYQFMTGGLAMTFVTQPWTKPIMVFGCLTVIMSSVIMVIWRKAIRPELILKEA